MDKTLPIIHVIDATVNLIEMEAGVSNLPDGTTIKLTWQMEPMKGCLEELIMEIIKEKPLSLCELENEMKKHLGMTLPYQATIWLLYGLHRQGKMTISIDLV